MSQSENGQFWKVALALSISLFVSNFFFSYWQNRISTNNSSSVEKYVGIPRSNVDPSIKSSLIREKSLEDSKDETKSNEKLVILENDFFQLVMGSLGASIKEINLPIRGRNFSNENNTIQPVEIDFWISENSPENALFPLDINSDETLKNSPPQYYPLIRRGLFNGPNIPLEYRALSLSSDYEDFSNIQYNVSSETEKEVTFVYRGPTRTIRRTYQLTDSPYTIRAITEIEGDCRGIWIHSGIPETEMLSNQPSPAIYFRHLNGNNSNVSSMTLPKTQSTLTDLNLQWVANGNNFFSMIMEPVSFLPSGFQIKSLSSEIVPTRISLMPRYQKPGFSPGYDISLPLPNQGGKYEMLLFAGPLSKKQLKIVDQQIHNLNDPASPLFSFSWRSTGWLSKITTIFSNFLDYLLSLFFSWTNSWVISIILLTFVLRLILYPFNAWAFASMEKVRRLAPQVQAIQERYKDVPHKAQTEIFALYKMHKINPIMGLVPLLAQMPFLIGMFEVLKSNFELRGAQVIPGWIDNLAAPDVFFSWANPIFPIIGNQLHLLPIILALAMFIQQRLAMGTSQQSVLPAVLMTCLFLLMFYKFPAGLNIYWMSSILLGMAQQALTRRRNFDLG